LSIDADPTLDRDRHLELALHQGDCARNQLRFSHQASAKAALLHAIGRAADVEVDLIVAVGLAQLGRFGERVRR
jgi:hypothetical protein